MNGEGRGTITRVIVENYKSLAQCDVTLGATTLLVGANNSGKSNFLEALTLVADALRGTLEGSLRTRGGPTTLRRPLGRRTSRQTFDITWHMRLADQRAARYRLTIAPDEGGAPTVVQEFCTVEGRGEYKVARGRITSTLNLPLPSALPDRLFLVNASGWPVFRPVYDLLVGLESYNLAPNDIRALMPADTSGALSESGAGLAALIGRLEKRAPDDVERALQYLRLIVPNVSDVNVRDRGGYRVLEFTLTAEDGKSTRVFPAHNMSDGTLRAFALLVALFAPTTSDLRAPTLIALEEPETALHPAAVGVLLDAIREAAISRQVVVTTHSPDLLQAVNLDREVLLSVELHDGATTVRPLDRASRDAIHAQLFTPGELLRMNQLRGTREGVDE